MPAAFGIFSGMGDFARDGDSTAMYALRGLSGHLDPPDESGPHDPYYTGKTDPADPILSPIYSDLHGMPPTLFITSGRDLLLSGTVNLHRAPSTTPATTPSSSSTTPCPTPSGTAPNSPKPSKPTTPWPTSSSNTSRNNGSRKLDMTEPTLQILGVYCPLISAETCQE